MDLAMISRWNERITWEDDVWFLGDFTFYNSTKTSGILSRLQGRKHLIWGNHDKPLKNKLSFFESEQQYKVLTVEGQKLILFHFPILSWWDVGRGSWHLHGHSHSNLPPETDMARLDCGVDGHNFYPWSFEEVKRELKNRHGLPGDHHDH
jgi:calcineurin-like phosphoesterase family protein